MSFFSLAPPEFWLGFAYGAVCAVTICAALWAVYWPQGSHPTQEDNRWR